MAIYHLHVGIVSRKTGRSAVAAAAYRAADKLRSDYDGATHDYSPKSNAINAAAYRSGERLQNEQSNAAYDYTNKRGVVHTEIMLPRNAPQEYQERVTLWNAVEKSEKRKDAQTARDIDIALPVELDRQGQIQLVREYVQENFIDKGMCADWAIHDKKDGNPHTHILLTTREVTENGFGKKNREWNGKDYVNSWRENWAVACNERLKAKGIQERIDNRTLSAQGVDREPTIHIGVAVKHMERKGLEHDRIRKNKEIITHSESRKSEKIAERMYEHKETHFIFDKDIGTLQESIAEANREMNAFRAMAEEIAERAEHIQNLKGRLEEIKAERQGMSFLKSKKSVDEQVQRHQRTYDQATSYFNRTFIIEPEQAAKEVVRLGRTVESKKHLLDKLQEKLTPLIEQKETAAFEYQRLRLLAEISPDRQKILDRLMELEKESRVYRRLVRDDIAWVRCERMLEIVNERNFSEILKEVQPEHAEKLIKLRVLEGEREYERIRYR